MRVHDLRGNVTTRLRKFDESSWDAVILAAAGLERLGLSDRVSAPIPTEEMLPAVGQGALALEARAEDTEVVGWLGRLGHAETAWSVRAERAFLRRLQGGCQVPIAALGSVADSRLTLEGFIGTTDGLQFVRRRLEGPVSEAETMGIQLAEDALADGGREILVATRIASSPSPGAVIDGG